MCVSFSPLVNSGGRHVQKHITSLVLLIGLRACLHVCGHTGLSQVGGSLSVLPLSGLSHSHIDALQPLLSVFLILSFQDIRLIVGEDLKGPWQTPITALLGYNLIKEEGKKKTTKSNCHFVHAI